MAKHHTIKRIGGLLIIDDSAAFRDAARDLLMARGYTVVAEAGDGATALEAVQRHRPDGVLLDMRLNDGSGLDVCATLTRAHPGLAVLLVSADRNPPSQAVLEESGARGFVFKSQLVRTDLTEFWPEP
jgi:DNA-binding NarL/FixJ family response regulator